MAAKRGRSTWSLGASEMNARVRELLGAVALWLVLVLSITFLIGSHNLPTYYALKERGVKVTAVVLDTQPRNHRLVHYSYLASGRRLEGLGSVGGGSPTFEALLPGSKLEIYVDPNHPEVSTIGAAAARFYEELSVVIFGGILLPSAIVGFVVLRSSRLPRKP